jgi:hypothetical protein
MTRKKKLAHIYEKACTPDLSQKVEKQGICVVQMQSSPPVF